MNKHLSRTARLGLGLAAAWLGAALPAHAQTNLANQPVFSATAVPGNLALALSVEYPTAVSNAHTDSTYAPASTYLGYFDPDKCYTYVYDSDELKRYFQPAGKANNHVCSKKWSGNFLNWATMQTIDPFRWALTGGYRVVDTPTTTIIEKANASGQGGSGNFPDRSITTGSIVSGATPMTWAGIKIRIQGLGNKMRFTRQGDNNSGSTGPTPFNTASNSWNDSTVWEVSVRVKVCDPSDAAGGLEPDDYCVAYGSNYKPEGLIQKYSQRIRFSAFGYLNDTSLTRDGAILRASQKFVGPTEPVAGGDPKANSFAEWDATTGVMLTNPNKTDADDTAAAYGVTISNSGVMNYLNKFGQLTKGATYKQYDPVGELYYAALRYYRNLGNVPEWSNPNTNNNKTKETYADGFPVITNWKDPILYSCQKNAILGIGDVNTHADRNLPGPSTTGNSEPTKPAAVAADNGFDAVVWTNKVGQLNGNNNSLGTVQNYGGCCNNNGALMAGAAYWANTQDIRPTMDGKQTVQTYWMDVLELQTYKTNNQFYLATKYGGAEIPKDSNFNPLGTTDLTQSWWHTGPASDTVGGQLRPDNYYTAGRPDTMVAGLQSAFKNFVEGAAAYTSSLNTASNNVSAGTESYGTNYDPNTWTGDIEANTVSLMSLPIGYTSVWKFSAKLKAQMGTDGTGWDKGRNIVTFKPPTSSTATGTAVAFRQGNLSQDQLKALDTTYVAGDDSANYVKYIRGDQSLESGTYRKRSSLVSDIINSQVVVMGPPQAVLSDASNPGYSAHVQKYKSRPNILIAGANSGLVHIINGSTTAKDGGKELFAYIPSAVITGPSGTPSVDGLASVGNPDFEHRYMVDARPAVAEVDFKRTVGSSLSSNEWHTIVVGGLGKGGRSLYALDLTTANEVTSEPMAVSRVLWEYTDSDMGFTFGTPVITKTAQHGWVVVVGSGYNNIYGTNKGKGAFYILNARTGALIQKVSLPTAGDDGTAASPTGLTHLETYYRDRQDATVESIYAGDLKGNLWRLDLTAASGAYPAPVKLATLTDTAGVPLPITSAPTPVINPSNNRRWIAIGTGQLLATTDIPVNRANRFYAILDGYQGRYTQSSDLPSGITMPFLDNASRHDFLDVSTTPSPLNFKTHVGYVMDLDTIGGITGYRMIAEADAFENLVAFSPVRPLSTDACNPSGTSFSTQLNLDTGASSTLKVDFAVDETRFVNDNGVVKLTLAGKPSPSGGGSGKKDGDLTIDPFGTGSGDKRLINWREIPLRN